jgi:hypothetical protein
VSNANTTSKVLYVVGGLTTALGATLWIVAPSSPSETTTAGLSFHGTF